MKTPKVIKVKLHDATDETKPDLEAEIVITHSSISINAKGYGDGCSQDGHGTPIMIEQSGGDLRAILWTDINEQDPQIVSMEGARENKRKLMDGICPKCFQGFINHNGDGSCVQDEET
jgi:hypothetical protein